MSSAPYLRRFVSERLAAAAEEILGVFEKTMVEYQEEIDRQRRLLDVVWRPEVKLQKVANQGRFVVFIQLQCFRTKSASRRFRLTSSLPKDQSCS